MLDAAADLILTYRYFFVFAVGALDGPLASFVIGFFVANGTVDFVPSYFCLLLGDLLTCLIIFNVGQYFGGRPMIQRLLSKAAVTGHVQVIRVLWHRHPAKTMFMSKLAYGLSTPFLIAAAVLGVPWNRFLPLVSIVATIQYAILLTIATLVGKYVGPANDLFGWAKIIAAIMTLVVIIYLIFGRRLRKMLVAEEVAEEAAEQAEAQRVDGQAAE